jgi:hypothetical protein
MAAFWSVMSGWLILSLISLAGLGLMVFWDWFVNRRLPFARWRVTVARDSHSRTSFVREIIRIRRNGP